MSRTAKTFGWPVIALAVVAGAALGGLGMTLARGGEGGPSPAAVRAAIMADPQMLPDAMEELQRREAAAAIGPQRAALERPYSGAWAGAADGDVTLVTFFDYACGFCRQSNAALARLLAEDPRLKVVYRELPVLGPESRTAALASLAAADQGRYRSFYDARFAAGRPTPETIARAQAAAGVQPAAPSDAHNEEIARNAELATRIRANGTPTFVVGDQVLHGAVGYEALKAAVAQARRS